MNAEQRDFLSTNCILAQTIDAAWNQRDGGSYGLESDAEIGSKYSPTSQPVVVQEGRHANLVT